jgi:hypothetical protein
VTPAPSAAAKIGIGLVSPWDFRFIVFALRHAIRILLAGIGGAIAMAPTNDPGA